jgi:glutamine synthetase
MPSALHEAIRELEARQAAVDIFGADVVAHDLYAARVEEETTMPSSIPGTASATWNGAS